MQQPMDFMDVADSDFLSSTELDDDSDSESDSEFEKYYVISAPKNRLFGRKRPLHVVLGSGKTADIILWRDKLVSASTLAGVTYMWYLFERRGYTLVTFICHSLLLLLAVLFFWTELSSFTNLSSPEFSEFILPERLLVNSAISMRYELKEVLIRFGVIVTGLNLKKFLLVTVTLWGFSVLANWYTVANLFYIVSVTLLTMPALYERHEDSVDIIAEKALAELNYGYAKLMKRFPGNYYTYKPVH